MYRSDWIVQQNEEDRADVESAQNEGGRTRVEFNVAGQKNKQKKKETAEAKGA